MAAPKFQAQKDSFHAELKRRINDYFQEEGIATTGNYKLYTKAIILTVSLLLIYTHLVFFTPASALLGLVECALLGGLTAAIGFNVMHDGSHGSFSKKKRLNEMAGLCLNVLGANEFMWNTKHNVIHHAYTNIDGVDDDLDAGPFLRLCETQKLRKIHRYQHLYFWAAYSMLFFFWVFFSDYQKYFTKKVGAMPLRKMKTSDHITFWGFKVLHIVFFAVLPIYTVGFLPWLLGFLTYGVVTGFVMSIVFQLAHTVRETHFPVAVQPANKLEDEWAVHQLKTTANFATNNKLVTWFAGGLNFQVEHHLFPKISHIHYPALSKIVAQACAEFNVPYHNIPNMRRAVMSHVMHLKQLSRA
ncbi:fatty acid desaturase family protein [Pontibacter akesuensis]|uniref:Linoleoyl-CoA desaturase n=1 Tax=Pontibacter akesuensis TaxID=388950 RepID=A0A1I7KWB1_9BACT|nr:acyl-CoA desaturase [Pontibacter akesuensis]GHA80506.1 fatty acid desaturase [Pontibacter akesuensis]SFV01715.1 linoleoyl-CoA desaturase [Pontibacter akesuensis]